MVNLFLSLSLPWTHVSTPSHSMSFVIFLILLSSTFSPSLLHIIYNKSFSCPFKSSLSSSLLHKFTSKPSRTRTTFSRRLEDSPIQIKWTLQNHSLQSFYAKESHNKIMWRHSASPFHKVIPHYAFTHSIPQIHSFNKIYHAFTYMTKLREEILRRVFITILRKSFCHDNTQLFGWQHFQMANVWMGKQCFLSRNRK